MVSLVCQYSVVCIVDCGLLCAKNALKTELLEPLPYLSGEGNPRSSDKSKPGEILGRKIIGPKVLKDYASPPLLHTYDLVML